MLPTKMHQSPSKRAHTKDKTKLSDPLHCVCIVHKSAFCGERGALVGGLKPRLCSLVIAQVALLLSTVVSTIVFISLFLLASIPLKGCSFQQGCKAANYFWNPYTVTVEKTISLTLHTYLMLLSVTWNIAFFIKLTQSCSHFSSYAQMCLVIIHTAGTENLQNWSRLWFKLFILV